MTDHAESTRPGPPLRNAVSDITQLTTSNFLTQSHIDPTEDYVNPLQQSSRWILSARAGAIRSAAGIGFGIMNMSANNPTKTIWLNATLGQWKGKGKIKVEIWEPKEKKQSPRAETHKPCPSKRPAIINFHGGGFALGQATDDAIWAGTAMKALNAVVFSVNYRLAPEHPFPTAVEDCADAILQIAHRSEEFNIDTENIVVSGFSAGATLSLASWIILQDPQRWDYQLAGVPPSIAGFALFYPLLDWTISRPLKRLTCIKPELTLSKNLTDLFDASYVYPPIPKAQRDDPRLSPGLMSDELLKKLPLIHLCICEYDMLFAEGNVFAKRLKQMHKDVSVRIVSKEKHAWDKPPPLWPKPSVAVEYGCAIETIKRSIGSTKQDS
ncbi:Alpha/Beta hydrolase protein [Xylariales sp. PMI_506]|nr:Alpha/Beta hydrolase protein [Xylariales sp. PMI_506]